MDFLFFDIECCNGNDICSFGYVVVDENFKVLEKKDIIINPNAKFKLGRAGFNPNIELAYSEKEFQMQPLFSEYYTTIKDLLTYPNRIILGHSVTSDIKNLLIACKRYNKELLNINAYDTQKFYSWFKGENRQYSLENIIKDLHIDMSTIKQHRSDDDALLSMFVAKKICEMQGLKLFDLIKSCSYSEVRGDDVYRHNFGDKLAWSTDKCGNQCNKNGTAMEQAFLKAQRESK